MTERRELRVAAVGDLHFDTAHTGMMRALFADVHRSADVLALLGDMTTHGRPEQMRSFVNELAGVEVPIVAVLGNHDYEAGQHEECARILVDSDRKSTCLNSSHLVSSYAGFCLK